MRRITLLLFLTFIIVQTNAQYLIVDDSVYGGNNLPLQDVMLTASDDCSAGISKEYYFDLNQDSINDIKFELFCYLYPYHDEYYMLLETFNDFSIHVDTNFMENITIYYFDTGQFFDTIIKSSTVRKYELGDTIFSNNSALATEELLLEYKHEEYVDSIDAKVFRYNLLFYQDTSYIALERSNGDLYYIKIYLPYNIEIDLIYAKTSAPVSVKKLNELSDNYIFPNPAREIIKFRKSFDLVQIYSMEGKLLIEKNLPYNQKTLDISNLKKGLYVVFLKTNRNRYVTKLLKL